MLLLPLLQQHLQPAGLHLQQQLTGRLLAGGC
jgi:hypothetical protein